MTRIKQRPRTKPRHAKTLAITFVVLVGLSFAGGMTLAQQDRQESPIPWEGHGSEHIEGCETGFHWIFSPGGGITNVTLHTEINGTPQPPIPMTQAGQSGQGAWHANTTLVDLDEGETPWVNFNGTAHAEGSLKISNCLDEPGNGVPQEPCIGPQEIRGSAHDGPPRNEIEWDSFPNATGYNLYRAEGGGGFVLLAQPDGNTTSFDDFDVDVGTTYTYRVTAQVGEEETDHCDEVEVTAIPVFTTLVTGALATALGVTAYAATRRRQ